MENTCKFCRYIIIATLVCCSSVDALRCALPPQDCHSSNQLNCSVDCEAQEEPAYCYAIWQNNTLLNEVHIVEKGCTYRQDCSRPSCVNTTRSLRDKMYCCCNSSLCNINVEWVPEVKSEPGYNTIFLIIGYTLIFIICVVTYKVYQCVRYNTRVPDTSETSLSLQRIQPRPGPVFDGPQSIETDSECLSKYKRDLEAKQKILRTKLTALRPLIGKMKFEVSRSEIGLFEESYRAVMNKEPMDLRKRLKIKFRCEEGVDYGGVAREWLSLLSHAMLNHQYGFFQYSGEDNYTLQINPDSSIDPEHLSYFHFIGRIIGIAIFHGHYIDGRFTTPFYKMLLNKSITLEDIEGVDPELHRSLTYILENKLDKDIIDTTFAVEESSSGVLKLHELKTGGQNIQLTEDNKKEYVELYVTYKFMRRIEQQFLALQKGLTEVVPGTLLEPFDEREIELIISGIDTIDIEDWKRNTKLEHCESDMPVVKWFWEIIEQDYSQEMRVRLLKFVTGSSRVPLQGFKALEGSSLERGPCLFTIHLIDVPTDNLPNAHTCFNCLYLPKYESKQRLLDKLSQAVEETCGFNIE